MVAAGLVHASPSDLAFRDPEKFKAGEIHNHTQFWEIVLSSHSRRNELFGYIQHGIDVFDFFQPFVGTFQGKHYDSELPPACIFPNNRSCFPFSSFVTKTILERVTNGSISVLGRVGEVSSPHLVMTLTIEPTKPRLCHDERFLNLWIVDLPFSLDKVTDLPRYVGHKHFQTVFDDKSGYDHVLLTPRSSTFFGFEWEGWYFCYTTIPFGWKASAYLYHTIGMAATSYIRSFGVPCSQYIDDRHAGHLRLRADTHSNTWSGFRLAEAAAFIGCRVLTQLGYFVGLKKSILTPQTVVPFLGYLSDSNRQAFLLPEKKKAAFIALREDILTHKTVSLRKLQKFAGKTMSFALVVPAAQLFSRTIFRAIANANSSGRPVPLTGDLLQEILHWRFLDSWEGFLPWKSEFHHSCNVVSDASNSGWGAVLYLSHPTPISVNCLWTVEERSTPIACREALALEKALLVAVSYISNARIDCYVDSQVVVNIWNKQGSKSPLLNGVLKRIFHISLASNLTLHLHYIPSHRNVADSLSRSLSDLDSTLSQAAWELVDSKFGPHSIDLMAIPANVKCNRFGQPLTFYSPFPLRESAGTNLFAQQMSSSDNAYIFPPFILIGPLLRFFTAYSCFVTMIVPDICPRRYWWPLLWQYAIDSFRLGRQGECGVILFPTTSSSGFAPKPIPWDIWVFRLRFN